ncbi:MAG: putative sulfate exporter family transporter [Methylobacterium sp.]|uniref:YeiH family protein n=1 Tax=Methylobacterium sp. TaxID=409 RepID=UPI0025F26837|nr:putative sulfate exporter family transporter [Methylobacterium sp.]MBX9933041.1 putative sulfate exporter family transporter [Methylobacterium sp.]
MTSIRPIEKSSERGAVAILSGLHLLPGIILCLFITALAIGVQAMEERSFGHPYIEALVVAILVGIAVRTAWEPGDRFRVGIAFSAKQLLEVAVTLLGASVSLGAIAASGPALLTGIMATVILAIGVSYGICRLLGLPVRMAILVACGNAICGNSAIAAVAPVIGAQARDVAAAIAFTAVLGVLVVLGLPLFVPLAGLTEHQYGVLAGLTVYAVPQVLAATVPVGVLSTQVGTLVKLVRVLMLGPVVVACSLLSHRLPQDGSAAAVKSRRPGLSKLVPWFILGFLLLSALRSLGLIPDVAVKPIRQVAGFLTIVSMAALGLGVDVRVLARVGVRVTLAVTASLAVLIVISLVLIRGLAIS